MLVLVGVVMAGDLIKWTFSAVAVVGAFDIDVAAKTETGGMFDCVVDKDDLGDSASMVRSTS